MSAGTTRVGSRRPRATLWEVRTLEDRLNVADATIVRLSDENQVLREHNERVGRELDEDRRNHAAFVAETRADQKKQEEGVQAMMKRYEDSLREERERSIKQNDTINALKHLVRNGVKV